MRDWFFVVASYDGLNGVISVSFTDRDGNTFENSRNAPLWNEQWENQLGNDIYMGGVEEPNFGSGFFRWLLEWLTIRLQSFDGILDEIAIYDKILSNSELVSQMNNELPFEGDEVTVSKIFKITQWNE